MNQLREMSITSPLDKLVLICRRARGGPGSPLAQVSTGLCDMAVRSMSNLDAKNQMARRVFTEAAMYAILDVKDYNERIVQSSSGSASSDDRTLSSPIT